MKLSSKMKIANLSSKNARTFFDKKDIFSSSFSLAISTNAKRGLIACSGMTCVYWFLLELSGRI